MVLEKVFSGCGCTEEATTGPLKKEAPFTSRVMFVFEIGYIYIYSCIYLLFYFSFLIHGRVFSFSRKIVIIDFLLMVYNVNK